MARTEPAAGATLSQEGFDLRQMTFWFKLILSCACLSPGFGPASCSQASPFTGAVSPLNPTTPPSRFEVKRMYWMLGNGYDAVCHRAPFQQRPSIVAYVGGPDEDPPWIDLIELRATSRGAAVTYTVTERDQETPPPQLTHTFTTTDAMLSTLFGPCHATESGLARPWAEGLVLGGVDGVLAFLIMRPFRRRPITQPSTTHRSLLVALAPLWLAILGAMVGYIYGHTNLGLFLGLALSGLVAVARE